MKRLAARDFEDILQVFSAYLFSAFDPLTVVSVPFPCSRDCSPPIMIWLCSHFSINSRNGTHWLSSDFTPTLRSHFLQKRSRNCRRSCEGFEGLLALPSTPWNYPEKKRLDNERLSIALKAVTPLQNRVGRGSKHSI